MVFLIALVVGVLAGYARGGRVSRIVSLPLRALWLIPVALLIQLLIFPLFGERPLVEFGTATLHLLSYALLILWLVLNLRVRPVWAIGGGAFLNGLVVLANAGYMPASAPALRHAGLGTAAEVLLSNGTWGNVVLMGDLTHLNFLGDWLFLPAWIPGAAAFSIGDLLIMAGLSWLVVKGMRGSA